MNAIDLRCRRALACVAALCCLHQARAASADALVSSQPQQLRIPLMRSDTSAALSVMAQQVLPPSARVELTPMRVTPAMRSAAARPLARAALPRHAVPSGPATPPMPQVDTGGTVLNFDGIAGNGAATGDVSAAVGETQYVQWVNNRLAVYNKADGALLLGPVDGNVVFTSFGGDSGADACRQTNAGQPVVQYDKQAQRWILTMLAWAPGNAATGPYFQCIAVSTSPNALGAYYRYAMALRDASGNVVFGDYPKMGVWTDAYYFTFVLFDSIAGGYRGPRVCGLDRTPMLAGGATSALCWDFGTAYGPLSVSDLDGTTAPPAGSPNFLLSLDFTGDGSGDHLFLWRLSFANASLSGPVELPVASFTIACPSTYGGACVRQPAPGELLNAMGDRLMPRLAYRHFGEREVLLANHSVQQPGALRDGALGVRWYEIRDPNGAVHVYQQGTIAPDGNSRWMGNIAMDKAGNIAAGYSVAGETTPPGIRYAGRLRSEPMGRMENEEVIINGNGMQLGTLQRWGKQSTMSVDPVSDCTFWYSNQYIASSGSFNWRTRIATANFRSCM